MIKKLRETLKERHPLIHCITNPISINQCANAILAVGGRPMMAEHPLEAPVITANAGAVLLNLGNITDVRMESMRLSAKTAKEKCIPFVLDVCGVACLSNRREYALSLMQDATPSVIKGNYSEILALIDPQYNASGVDAEKGIDEEKVVSAAKALAQKYQAVVLASGETDLITDGIRVICCNNGTPQLATITGTGCMQGALCAAYLSVAEDGISAAVMAAVMLGVCGQLAETEKGSGSFGVNLMDRLSTVTDEQLEEMKIIEENR